MILIKIFYLLEKRIRDILFDYSASQILVETLN